MSGRGDLRQLVAAAMGVLLLASGCTSTPTVQQVVIAPGDDWQAVVDATAPGSTFVIEPGVHRAASVVVRSGDRFVGRDGAVMDGSRTVEDWTRDGDRWTSDGVQPTADEPRGDLQDGWAQHGYPEELFLDGERLLHVAGPDDVGPGSWWFDVAGERLVLGEDPTGHEVAISVVPFAFRGPMTTDVSIEGLEVRRYATPSQRGAIDALEATDWIVRGVDVHHNHGVGVRVDRGMVLADSRIADNGQIGVSGAQSSAGHDRPIVVVNNEISGNGVLRYTPYWESGGVKLTHAEAAVVHDNVVVGNGGVGIWYDLDSSGGVITDNEVRDNAAAGIFYEISDRGTIARNVVTDNGHDVPADLAAGIWLSNSGLTSVTANVLVGNVNEILLVAAPREDFGHPVTGNLVVGNDVTITDGFVGLSVLTGDSTAYDPDVNRFRGNRYILDGCDPCFFWDERVDTDEWRRLGNDTDSTFTQETSS